MFGKRGKFSKKEKFAIGTTLTFILFETFIRTNDLYRYEPFVDIPSHILGGASVQCFAELFFPKHPFVWQNIAGIAWEVGEVMVDQIIQQPVWQQDGDLKDSAGDLFFNNVGGLIAHYSFKNIK